MKLRINNQLRDVSGVAGPLLIWALRDELGMTGTKIGCGAGLCGACTVLVDGKPTRACITPLEALQGKDIQTIEGLATGGALHPVQQAFVDEQVPQCGWCMSGQIMTAVALLRDTHRPNESQIVAAMGGNLCRCGCYVRIKRAVARAADSSAGATEGTDA